MLIEKRFFSEGMNGDLSPRLLSDKEGLNFMNCRMSTSEYGRNGRLENLPGTTLISQAVYPPYGYHQCIGSVPDVPNGRLIYALWNSSNDHGIYCYYFATGVTYAVIYDSQITSGLNFSKTDRIDRNFKIIDNKLYWVEKENNQPRKINIDKAIKFNHPAFDTDETAYTIPLDFSEITIIKPPPALAPNIQKSEDVAFENNFIANYSFEFAHQFVYDDNETSVVGTYSPASRLNSPSDPYNFIAVQMDALQVIPNTVQIVNLIVREGNGNVAKIIKQWNKNNADDLAEIQSHNNLINLLTFNFYNNITGESIAADYVLKPFDSVPIYAYTLEAARNRIFLGNMVSGYDTPTSTSLTISQSVSSVSGSNSVTKSVIQVRAKIGVPGPNNDYGYGGWYVKLEATDGVTPGYYLLNGTEATQILNDSSWTYVPALAAPVSSTSFAGLTFKGATQAATLTAIVGGGGNVLEGSAFYPSSYTIIITGINSVVDTVFKSRANYKFGVVFYDFAMRKCGVVTNDSLITSIPERNYFYTSAVRGLVWTLDNAQALTEIPDWAYYYTPVRTLNLRTRYFINSFDNAAKYVTKDADGVYVYTNTTYIDTVIGIGIDTTALVRSGLGYVFSEGDVAILVDNSNNVYELPVIAQDGKYIIVSAEDIGNLTTVKFIYEIYTPYQTSDQEPFYEVGQMYDITNPGEVSRAYSITSDVFLPDAYAITRNYETETFEAEAMSPNDLFYQTWYNDSGKPNFVTNLGQVRLPNFFRFSNTFIPGTSVNGLSTFEALNQEDVPQDCGDIMKLILTSKVQDEGTVMLAICKVQTVSIYLGETRITDNTGATQFFSASSGVVGTINALKGSYGTINPESVISYLGLVFWIDVLNGVVVQYSINGLDNVSKYKMSRFFKRYSKDYAAASTGNLDNINGFHHLPTAIDPFHKELLTTLPGLIYENYATTLPSYSSVPSYATSIVDRFDIYDQLAKTMSLSFEENKWGSNYEFMGEWYDYIQNTMFGFKNGYLYIHNNDTANWNNFYGTDYPVRVCLTGNLNPSMVKDLFNIALEASEVPDFTVAMANVPNQQITDLSADDWTDQESVLYATFLRDRLSPNASGTADQKLYTGDLLKDYALFVMCEWQQYNSLFSVNFINLGYSQSLGQKNITTTINT